MVDPITLSTIALGSTVLGGVTGAAGSLFGGAASSNAYTYQAGIAQMNAQIARQNAAYETSLGEQQAQQSGMKTRAQISQTRAAQGAGGLDVNTGSNADVRKSELSLGDYDQAIIRNNATRRAYGFEVEAVSQDAQSNLDRYAASTSITSSYFGAASSILGAGSSFSSKWFSGMGAGLTGGASA
jgi:hypothetical protein